MTNDVTNATPASAGHLFTPKPDITAYELAQIFEAVLFGQSAIFMPDMMAKIPEEMHRHFTPKPEFIQKGGFLSLLGL